MRGLIHLLNLLRTTIFRKRAEAELSDEWHDHLQSEIEANIAVGMSREEAVHAAHHLIGSASLYKEQCRDARGTELIDNLCRDLGYSLRVLRKNRLFTVVAVTTLALGISANTIIFTFLDNFLWRSAPFQNPQQVYSISMGEGVNMSYPNYLDFQERNSAFSALVAHRYNHANLSVRERDNYRLWGYEVTGNYFDVLGIKPQLGQFFQPSADHDPGAHPVLVISDRCWRSRFEGDKAVIGKAVKVNGFPFTIVGVAPASFNGVELLLPGDYWAPMSMAKQIEPSSDWLRSRSAKNIWVLGRVKPGTTEAQAEANLNQLVPPLAKAYPNDLDAKTYIHLARPGLVGHVFREPMTQVGSILMTAAGFCLLLACINLAGMLLARASDRTREISIRLAVGAGRTQLLRQMMTENLILALAGGLLGFALTALFCQLFNIMQPAIDIPISAELRPNWHVLCFTLALAVLTTLLFGLMPAIQSTRVRLTPGLKDQRWFRNNRWSLRDILMTSQIAFSVVLVICSVLVVRSLHTALKQPLGFDPDHAVSVSVDLRSQGYNDSQALDFANELLRKTADLPGVDVVGFTSHMPLRVGGNHFDVSRADRALPSLSERKNAFVYNVSPGYLRAAGTTLLSGRDFSPHDRQQTTRVVLVNETLVTMLFNKQSPIGQFLRLGGSPSSDKAQVVGVVENGKYTSLNEPAKAAVFLPVAQFGISQVTVVARTHMPSAQAVSLLRKTLLDADRSLSIFDVGSLREQLALPLLPARLIALVLGLFGSVALVLATSGLLASLAYSVSRRTREIGIRMAIGAARVQVVASLLKRTVLLSMVGVTAGITLAFVSGRLLSAILYGVSAHDPLSYALALFLMLISVCLAAIPPVLRASRIDPAIVLREQ